MTLTNCLNDPKDWPDRRVMELYPAAGKFTGGPLTVGDWGLGKLAARAGASPDQQAGIIWNCFEDHIDPKLMWVGAGFKMAIPVVTGSAGSPAPVSTVGQEHALVAVYNVAQPSRCFNFVTGTVRSGLQGGGSAGGCLAIVTGVTGPADLAGFQDASAYPDLNLAIAGKWSDFVKALRYGHQVGKLGKFASALAKHLDGLITQLINQLPRAGRQEVIKQLLADDSALQKVARGTRAFTSLPESIDGVSNALDFAKLLAGMTAAADSKTKAVTLIDIPGLAAGVEFSVVKSQTTVLKAW
jgi:hypothetical protein